MMKSILILNKNAKSISSISDRVLTPVGYVNARGKVNSEQWRMYGGKELQTVNGLNLYDFHARWQDYATCWFTTQDPLAEKYHALSPYIYCAGNPIMLTDPTGMRFEYAEDMTPKQQEQLDVGYVC
jgi:RHS repeat-associated protein